jgi:hypothetical protein
LHGAVVRIFPLEVFMFAPRQGLWVCSLVVVAVAGCAGTQRTQAVDRVAKAAGRMYIDSELGFEVMRPAGNWTLAAKDETTPEGLSVPVVLRHVESGAQVVVQVAPAVATPSQFAERLTLGFRQHPGFHAGDVELLALAEGAVGFQFDMGEKIHGRVAVLDGPPGKILMALATWPAELEHGAPEGVEMILKSLRPVAPVQLAAASEQQAR